MSEDWYGKAKCKGKHMDIWYPPMDANNPSQYYSVGKAICDRCPVWDMCLEQGMKEVWGMWGGLTPQERKAIDDPKSPHLRDHGTIQRFRQGCSCDVCMDVAYVQLTPINSLFIPFSDEELVIDEVKESILRVLGQSTL